MKRKEHLRNNDSGLLAHTHMSRKVIVILLEALMARQQPKISNISAEDTCLFEDVLDQQDSCPILGQLFITRFSQGESE